MNGRAPGRHVSRRDARTTRAFRRSLCVVGVLGVLVTLSVFLLNRPKADARVHTTNIDLPDKRVMPVEQAPQVRFVDVTEEAGIRFKHENGAAGEKLLPETMGSGCALFDYDGDGDQDLLLTGNGQSPRLLRNDQHLDRHWIRLRLIGTRCNRDAIGAWIEVAVEDRVLARHVMPTRGYLSQSELEVTFGLGRATEISKTVVHWPDGSLQTVDIPHVDRLYVVEQASTR